MLVYVWDRTDTYPFEKEGSVIHFKVHFKTLVLPELRDILKGQYKKKNVIDCN